MRRIVWALAALTAACSSGSIAPAASTAPPEATTATTTSPATTAAAPVGETCAGFGEPMVLGEIAAGLSEISGLAAGRADPEVLWAHEDSGGGPVLWALNRQGDVLSRIEVAGAEAIDWEDLALGPGPGGDHIYLADTGDNARGRESVALYRFPEPAPGSAVVTAEALEVVYPDGPRDVEALLVDPADGAVYLIDKGLGPAAGVYRVPAAAWEGDRVEATRSGTVTTGLLAPVTGADIAPDGSVIVVRTYGSVLLFGREPGTPLLAALEASGCRAPAPPEPQGEAIAWSDGGYLTVAEGAAASIYFVSGR